ncbi:MAG: putative selenocysteine system protein [Candidatus Thorarchaeota archaeon]
MADGTDASSSSLSIDFVDDPAVVFRVTWYAVSYRPGVYLTEYSEPESKSFHGRASFSIGSGGDEIEVSISIAEGASTIQINASGASDESVASFLKDTNDVINGALDKYRVQETDEMSRVRRALVAKTCWDRLVYLILKKHPLTEVYYQLAHGREMMIKATEGGDLHPITLSTSGWLSKIETLPREEPLPGNLATALAKKSVEWKRDTIDVLQRYL